MRFPTVLALISLASNIYSQTPQNQINVSLNTKFQDSGYGAEIAEFIAQHTDESTFFKFISNLNGKLNNDQTIENQYNLLIETAEAVTKFSESTMDILKFSLASRSLSAKVAASSQLGNQVKTDGLCNVFVQFSNGQGSCLNGIDEKLEQIISENKHGVDLAQNKLPNEHIFPSNSASDAPFLILYGLIEEPRFHTIYQKMVELAENGIIKLSVRFFIRDEPTNQVSTQKIRLSGYGIELAIKSQEYKAVDDSKVEESSDGNKNDNEIEKDPKKIFGDEEIEGLNFLKLAENFPEEDLQKLKAFRQHLVDSGNELTPLKAWQVQDLSYQSVVQSKSENFGFTEAVDKLEDLILNFPSRSKKIAKVKVPQKLKYEIEQNQNFLGKNGGIREGSNQIILNGKSVEISPDSAQLLERQLHRDSKILDKLSNLKMLSKSDISKLSRFSSSENSANNGNSYALDITNPNHKIAWLNDIEKDKKYRTWSTDWFEMLRPTWPGYLHKIRHNFVNIVIFIDPAAAATINYLEMIDVYFQNDVPARIGLVFVDGNDPDSGSDLLRIAFNKISTKEKAFKWLRTIHQKWELDDRNDNPGVENLSLEYIKEKTEKKFGGADKFAKVIEMDDSKTFFFEESGLKNLPNMVINGEPVPDQILSNPEEMLERGVYQLVSENIQKVAKAIYYKEVTVGENYLEQIMKKDNVVSRLNSIILKGPYTYPKDQMLNTDAEVYDPEKPISFIVTTADGNQNVKNLLNSDEIQSQINVQFVPTNDLDNTYINCNGKQFGPFTEINKFDIDLIIKLTKQIVVSHIQNSINSSKLDSETIFKISQILYDLANEESKVEDNPMAENEDINIEDDFVEKYLKFASKKFGPETDKHSGYWLTGSDQATHELIVILNPLSEEAQIILPIIKTFNQIFSSENSLKILIIFNCIDISGDIPIKNYYRYVLSAKPQFDNFGNIDFKSNLGHFSNLPSTLLLTLNVKAPEAWAIEQYNAAHDLDNIKFENIESKKVFAEFELEYVLLEGHCHDNEGSPPRGLQYILTNQKNTISFDTIVMANLGYFQLKATPGAWNLKLRDGASSDIYFIKKFSGGSGIQSSETISRYENIRVIIDNYYGIRLQVTVDRNQGQENKDVLEESFQEISTKSKAKKTTKEKDEAASGGIWNSVKNAVGLGSNDGVASIDGLNLDSLVTSDPDDVINIFSLASGHLYERFFRIMMVSVRRHTTAKLRFWALKNYASPAFKKSAKLMEKKYNIEINFVQYKWPQWLRRQREKQRTMWGYKILFLDVLFPLNIEKIIFVDADQIVRTDLRELRDLDLQGNPYGYTPFCSDRKEMDGFRFWKSGYWKNHLGPRKYHISAIYVVDLNQFRKVAAGDRLRGQYQGLSADPNSLANLDQDLPNNMIHQVGIKSLPQEWLWCETWCSDKSKTKAKTIDLCNNPLTKEPKLDAAVRIVPEWEGIDSEIKKVLEETDDPEPKVLDKNDDQKTEL